MILHLLVYALLTLGVISAVIAGYFLWTSRDPGWEDAWSARQKDDGPILPADHPSAPQPVIRAHTAPLAIEAPKPEPEDTVAGMFAAVRAEMDAYNEEITQTLTRIGAKG